MSDQNNTSTRGRGRPRKEVAGTKLSKLNQTHGKDESNKRFKPMTMEQIWGGDGTGRKYNTLDPEKYREYVGSLNRADLQKHATRVGLVPIDNTTLLKKRLYAEHKRHASLYKYPEDLNPPKSQEELAAMEEKVKQILG